MATAGKGKSPSEEVRNKGTQRSRKATVGPKSGQFELRKGAGKTGTWVSSTVVKKWGAWEGEAMEKVRVAVQGGLPVDAVGKLQDALKELGVSRPSEFVEAIASRATRRRRDTLTPEQGEKLARIARVMARAVDVWEDSTAAAKFLTTPHEELEGASPLVHSQTEIGARQVEELLLKLDLGLPV